MTPTIDPYTLTGNWHYPTSIRFGPGRIGELARICREFGLERPLLVTDPGLASMAMVSDAAEMCRAAGLACEIFSDVQANPVEANVAEGVRAFRDGGHDGVIGFGGGSALDAAKAVALMSGQNRPIWDFEDREDWWTRADPAGIAPVVAAPTTSGTGSEVGRASVITDRRDHTKKIIFHPKMMPVAVIADPELTVGLPAPVTAAVGMDALSHNLEAFCSPVFHPMAQGIALEGIRLVKEWLPAACADGNDLAARACMQVASTMGATAFQKGLGAMHSMSHPCGSVYGTHHGLTNAVVMPYVLEFNRPSIEGKMTGLARGLGLDETSFEGVVSWVLDLRERIGIPRTLVDIGVPADAASRLAPMALVDPSSATNPIGLTTPALESLYENALEGRIELG
ncbi:MAG: iron-containing alcohol dehydrogenase [Thiotrichales bacterium]|nr:iron-containing alcohol dehydrogenase [Thiotrichales bacterium]MCY4286400.1 iron-containing alcohol dehydrogenase [Thiotrichales bacterium]MCY4348606.1 iron-containing alcohol dehydrogenase [Thiotrichales bacterium]